MIEDNVVEVNETAYGVIMLANTNSATVTGNQIKSDIGTGLHFYNSYGWTTNSTLINNILDVTEVCYPASPVPDNNNTITPNTLPWDSTVDYDVNDTVLHDSNDVYECNTAHTDKEPPDANYWDFIKTITW